MGRGSLRVVLVQRSVEWLAQRHDFADVRAGVVVAVLPRRHSQRIGSDTSQSRQVVWNVNRQIPGWSQKRPVTVKSRDELTSTLPHPDTRRFRLAITEGLEEDRARFGVVPLGLLVQEDLGFESFGLPGTHWHPPLAIR